MAVEWTDQEIINRVRAGAMNGVTRGIGLVDQEATRLVMRTAKTGRIYRRRGVVHQASAPGEPFANDTGALMQSKTIELMQSELLARLVFRTKYAPMLEYGTRKMEPRPYARPALENMREQVVTAINEEIMGALR